MVTSSMILGLEHLRALERLGIAHPFLSYIVVLPINQLQGKEKLPLNHWGLFKPLQGLPAGPTLTFLSKASKKDAQPSLGKPGKSKGPVLLHSSSDDMAPSLLM
ncbi:hypothetical protein NC653_027878 [Populus alba x Populus x berolinensis]|uniref:Uncharacterized protein n=1 Tax=Populus alba x Populus x berolinensis TaxID=444605 RepID=A0AAD6M6G6_9ROSI|nr:hypothetical protein NC653_027878 [Populus alba x Populus x berolinensis]